MHIETNWTYDRINWTRVLNDRESLSILNRVYKHNFALGENRRNAIEQNARIIGVFSELAKALDSRVVSVTEVRDTAREYRTRIV